MTAEDILNASFESHKNRMADKPYGESFDVCAEAMKEYAEMKCKELLEIVAKKAKIRDEDNDTYYQPHIFYCNGDKYKTWVDKDSILNAVDLKEFIK